MLDLAVYINRNRNTCIVTSIGRMLVHFVEIQDGCLNASKKGIEPFSDEWQLLEGYPVDKAAQKYLASFLPRSESVQSILEGIIMAEKKVAPAPIKANKKPITTKAEPAPKAEKKVATPPKAEKKVATPKEDRSQKKIMLVKGTTRKFNESSVRGQCFAVIKNGMTVDEYIKATSKFTGENEALACLGKFVSPSKSEKVCDLK